MKIFIIIILVATPRLYILYPHLIDKTSLQSRPDCIDNNNWHYHIRISFMIHNILCAQ